jgi:hypothetical protein
VLVQVQSSALPLFLYSLPVFDKRQIRKIPVLPDIRKHHPGDAFPQVRSEIDLFENSLFVPVAEVIAGNPAVGKEQAFLQDVLAEPVSYCRIKRGFHPENEKTYQVEQELFPGQQVSLLGAADQSSFVIKGERSVFRSSLFEKVISSVSQT